MDKYPGKSFDQVRSIIGRQGKKRLKDNKHRVKISDQLETLTSQVNAQNANNTKLTENNKILTDQFTQLLELMKTQMVAPPNSGKFTDSTCS